MPWEARREECTHVSRPIPRRDDKGRIWRCDYCEGRWMVEVVNFDPWDINPGELGYQVYWVAQP